MKKSLLSLLLLIPFVGFSQGTWTKQASGISTHLLAVHTLNTTTSFAVGVGGKMIKTIDGGKTWIDVTSGSTKDLYNIHFTDTSNGYAIGNESIRTTDGGKNWNPMTITNLSGILFRDMFWLTEKVGFVSATKWASEGFLFKTIDGGATWKEINLPTCKGIYGVVFTDTMNGHLVSFIGEVLKTKDGGKNWSLKSVTSKSLGDIVTVNAAKLVFAGRDGALYISQDSGSTWTSKYSGIADLSRADFADEAFGTFVGGSISQNTGIILTTKDSGKTWSEYDTKTSRLTGVHLYSTNLGFAVGLDGTILKYVDNSTSTNQIKASLNTLVYPNPIAENESLIVSIKTLQKFKNIQLDIYNADGRLVKSIAKPFNSKTSLDIKDLSSGIYNISIFADAKFLNAKRFVKVN